MRFHPALLLLLPLMAVPACDKAKEIVAKAKLPKAAATAPAAAMPVVQELDPANYNAFVASAGRLIVVDFHADWCGPCQKLGPVLEQVAGEFGGRVAIGKINVDHARELATSAGVSGIPDIRLFRDGKEVDKFVGAVDESRVRALFQKHTDGLQVASLGKPDGDAAAAPVEPAIQPMKKDWLPPGIERR